MTDELMREVEAAVQRERAMTLLRTRGKWIALAAALAVTAGAGALIYQDHAQGREEAATAALTQGREHYIAGKARAALASFETGDLPQQQRALQALWQAKAQLKRGHKPAALDALAGALPDAKAPYRELICVQALLIDPAEPRFADCGGEAEGPFAPLLAELEALAHLERGDAKAARDALPAEGATPAQQERLRHLRATLNADQTGE